MTLNAPRPKVPHICWTTTREFQISSIFSYQAQITKSWKFTGWLQNYLECYKAKGTPCIYILNYYPRLPLGLCALPAPETATPALAYTATPESAILELPCAAIVFRNGRMPTICITSVAEFKTLVCVLLQPTVFDLQYKKMIFFSLSLFWSTVF